MAMASWRHKIIMAAASINNGVAINAWRRSLAAKWQRPAGAAAYQTRKLGGVSASG